jgi:hypothetical protein
MCTRLCSVNHYGPRVKPLPKRAESIKIIRPTKTDRSLSPMRFDKNEGIGRRLTSTTNKDWALSEVYKFVRAKTIIGEDGDVRPNPEF